jgi:hypothetical protein
MYHLDWSLVGRRRVSHDRFRCDGCRRHGYHRDVAIVPFRIRMVAAVATGIFRRVIGGGGSSSSVHTGLDTVAGNKDGRQHCGRVVVKVALYCSVMVFSVVAVFCLSVERIKAKNVCEDYYAVVVSTKFSKSNRILTYLPELAGPVL